VSFFQIKETLYEGAGDGISDNETERKLAARLFNETWRLLDKTDRTAAEDTLMIYCAHASRYHWEAVGDASNRAIGEWQISRLQRPRPRRTSAAPREALPI
jgi:hypothetical protein